MSDKIDTTLRLERLIPIQPHRLFALWTQPAQLAKWWAPEGYKPDVHALNSRPGGHWRITMRHVDGHEIAHSGVFRIVDPPRRLSFTWAWEDASGVRGHETEVTVTFDATPGGTRLVLLQQRFEAAPAREKHFRGWSAAFDRIAVMSADTRHKETRP